MAQELYTLSLDSIKYITGLINQIVNLPNDVINNTNLADNLTFSNIHIKNLIDQCLIDANTEAQKLVGALTHLTCKKTTTQPTLGSSELNVIYLYSIDGTPPFQQFLKISDTELIDLGSTSISLNDYLTATEIASIYAKQIDLDTLTDEINNIKNDIGTETMTTTSTTLKGAINELFQCVSDGKTLVASAITDKGVDTLATDTFQTMASNISNITGGDLAAIYSAITGHGLNIKGNESVEEVAIIIQDLLTVKTFSEVVASVEDFTNNTDNTIHENDFVEGSVGKIPIEPKELLFVDKTDYIEFEEITKSEYNTSILLS